MKFRFTALALCLGVLISFHSYSQDFSNKGKDFWVGYGLHCRMFQGSNGGTQNMVLYFATDALTNVRVEIPALGYVQSYSIPANTIFTTNPLPKTGGQDARLTTEGIHNKGIHISSDQPIVAYAHIYNGNVSGATLLFPTTTLGKEYYSINFDQHSNEGNSNCFFYAVATDTGTTTIEVTPSANTQNMTAGNTYTFNLAQGQVFNALGIISGNNGVDLTGSRIRSISTGAAGCKRIAVFSCSGKINIHCPLSATNNSADNYMVQAFPKNAWGKYYLTVPTSRMPNNFFRIAVSDPATIVKLNGTVLTGLINNFYYQVGQTGIPNSIEADKPVMVAQYITSANQCGNTSIGSDGDPEVIYLSPVEQNIDKVILNSTPNFAINSALHYINIVIPNTGTALNSFRIDGAVPASGFVTHPQNPAYSYLVENVSPGQHIIQSDSGFNAIAYGYGAAESYGYNAGANVKDLYQFVSVKNQYATVDFPAACKSSPFYFSITFPYQPTEIKWSFNGLFPDTSLNNPAFDSTWAVNGKQLYKYTLPRSYSIGTIGTYPIKIMARNPTPEGCSGEQEISYDLQVFERPVADFNFNSTGCVTDSVYFTDNTNTNGRPTIRWSWDFSDGGLSSVKNPVHKFGMAGSYPVRYSVITDIGCLSDTVSHSLVLSNPPLARFGISSPNCQGKAISFSDSSQAVAGTIVKWYWDFGDGSSQVIATTNATQTHTYSSTGSFTVKLVVESSTGCKSMAYSIPLIIYPNPVVDFSFTNACLPGGTMQFTNSSTIADGTENSFIYQWNFGDGAPATGVKSPSHNYTTTGPFPASLTVISGKGCTETTVKTINTIYNQPQSAFNSPTEVCFGGSINFTDQSTAPNSTISQWQWNFGDGNVSNSQHPSYTYTTPGTYTVTLTAVSAAGCPSMVTTRNITVHSLPTPEFISSVPTCVTRDIRFTDGSAPNSGNLIKWTWDMGDGISFIRNSATPFMHSFGSTGTYTVTLVTETDKGCTRTVSKTITIHPLPQPGFILPDNCLSDPHSPFTDTSSIADGSGSQFGYLWNFGDPNASPSNPNTSTLKDPKHKYTVVGPYDVTLIVTSGNGCADTLTRQLFVNGTQPQSGFITAGPYCSNISVGITNNSTVDVGRIVKLEIFWDDVNDPANKTLIPNPGNGTQYSHSYPEFFSPATRDYVVRVVAYSGDSCWNVSSRTITLLATPEIIFNPLDGVCRNLSPFNLTQAGITNGLPGNGVYSGIGVTSGMFNPQLAGIGTHTLRYTYTAANGCVNFKEQNIIVYPVPTVTAGPDRFMLEGGSTQLMGSGTGNNLTYVWTPPVNLSDPGIPQPQATPADDITYSLKVTSADGCEASDQVFVKVLKTPAIPNTFSPNGDGIHDRWEIKYLESYPGATVDIFNRYGQKVFHSTGYSVPWDGSLNGKPLPAGTYYYLINPKNGRKQMSGFVDIIR